MEISFGLNAHWWAVSENSRRINWAEHAAASSTKECSSKVQKKNWRLQHQKKMIFMIQKLMTQCKYERKKFMLT